MNRRLSSQHALVVTAALALMATHAHAEPPTDDKAGEPKTDKDKTDAARQGKGWRGLGGGDARGEDSVQTPDAVPEKTTGAQSSKPGDQASAPQPSQNSGDRGGRYRPSIAFAVGYRGLALDFQAEGNDGMVSYEAAANALTVSIGVTVPLMSRSSKLVVDVEALYSLAVADSGLEYLEDDGTYDEIPLSTHELQADLLIGYRLLGNSIIGAVRAGYRLDAIFLATFDNPANLPRERLHGLTLGAVVKAMTMRDRLTVQAGVDRFVVSTRTQTGNLRDGPESTASAWWGHVGLDYLAMPRLTLALRYAIQRSSTEWDGPSERLPGVFYAVRDDISYVAYLGLGRAF